MADIRTMVPTSNHDTLTYALTCAAKVVLYPRIQAVLLYRVSNLLYSHHLRPLAHWVAAVALRRTGAEIHPAAEIGPGFCLVHSFGVVIGDTVRIGRDFECFHAVTIGDNLRTIGQPIIGDGVTACAGAMMLGPITVGDRALIGANAMCLTDVPADSVAVGAPARVHPRRMSRADLTRAWHTSRNAHD